jgi:vancomycin permeability regulator SanA
MSDPLAPLRRGPWRYLRDADVLHSLCVALLVMVLSGGLVWLAYLIHVWRTAARSPLKPDRARVLLIFGRKLEDERPEQDYIHRLQRGLTLARMEDVERMLVLGGNSGSHMTEAKAGADWLRAQGFPGHVPLILEQASTDSLENLRHARELLKHEELPSVALITSRYHLARCLLLARRLGFDAQPVAAEDRLPGHARYRLRMVLESGYLMWIDIGLRWAHLIGHERMAARIR